MPKILFVASEAYPLIKTGGLGDIIGSLPVALTSLKADIRLLLPAYQDVLARAEKLSAVAELRVAGATNPVRLLEGRLPGTEIVTWFVDYPQAFGRAGNPYLDSHGMPWSDNAMRFALFARVAVLLALGRAGLGWIPDVVHCHDWQTGLVPALLVQEKIRPATVFTIHNLAYQGLFPLQTFTELDLPASLWSFEALEFHGQLSFIKGGLVFADRLTTVSPTYASEIQTPEFGSGLDGLLRHRSDRLTGILNGIDGKEWNPAHDPFLSKRYSARRPQDKYPNKTVLQKELGLAIQPDTPLIGMVGRLVQQKGIDLVIETLPGIMHRSVQLVLLGTGESGYEEALREQAQRYSGKLAVRIGYDERLAHLIEAGSDMFLMPSRFEPCGLNQLYSMRYGTVPIVRRIGGLADSVIDATDENLMKGIATGIVFEEARASKLMDAIDRALVLQKNKDLWQKLILTGMREDFSWHRRAAQYLRLYRQLASSNIH